MRNDLTLVEMIQDVDMGGRPGLEIHPAWRAIVDVHPRMIGVAAWRPGLESDPGFRWDWEIALSMIVRGYGADVVRCPELQGWARYLLPPVYVYVAHDEEQLPVDPAISPMAMIEYYRRTRLEHIAAGDFEEWT